MKKDHQIIPIGKIEERILLIRGEKIIIDADLAEFYNVTTSQLNQQAKRNKHRFPYDFMFQLTEDEKKEVITNCDHLEKLKFSSSLPYAFTEHGAIMAASVLNSQRAIEMSVFIVRAFVKMRQTITEYKEVAQKISQLESKLTDHDSQIQTIIKAIKMLMQPKLPPKKHRIGFKIEK